MRGSVYVVDDEDGPRESLRMILKQDHDVAVFNNGPAALEAIAVHQPDLVFLDLRMPEMEGTEVLRRIKESWPDVNVAIITAFAAVDSARLAVRYGALDYLTKPYSVADVERIVDRALRARRQQHDAEVLSAQLAKMAETIGGWARSLDADRRADVDDAMEDLKSVQTSLPGDLESVRKLSELGEVTAEVTHDINNLLTVILTNSQYLLLQLDPETGQNVPTGRDPGAVTSRVSRIVRAAEDCSTLIRRIKDFVRLNVNYRPTVLHVNDLVSSAVDLKRESIPPSGGTVEYVVHLEDVPNVFGDLVAIRTVLVNLIENSLEALTGNGRIEVSTGTDGTEVTIAVKDNGRGMSPTVLERATQAFFSSGKDNGTGLGLSTAERVMSRCQGRLTLASEEGVGTTVTLHFPIATEQEQTEEAPQAAERDAAWPAPAEGQATIILVDDEDGIRELMASVFETEGYQVLQAEDGKRAWELFSGEQARGASTALLVVTDHEMPGLTGRELARRVKAADSKIPVLLVSGYISEHKGPEDALVLKPFDVDELLNCARGLLSGTES
jgi:signal transduction histidine kinase